MRFGIPTEDAILAATMIPAKVVGMENEIGSLNPERRQILLFVMRTGIWNRYTLMG